MPPGKKKCFGCDKVIDHIRGHNENFFIITSSPSPAECEIWKRGFSVESHSRNSVWWSDVKMRELRFPRLRLSECVPVQEGELTGSVYSLLHHVLDPRQRLLYWHCGVLAASLLGELQDRHVAEWAHLPHLQPFNEAPVKKQAKRGGHFKMRQSLEVYKTQIYSLS